MKITKVYDKNFIGDAKRKKTEVKLFEEGYKVIGEEEFKQSKGGCLTALIFFPLLFIKYPMIKVTYKKTTHKE